MKKRLQAVLGVLAIIIVTVAFLVFTYFGNYYTYRKYAKRAMKSTDTVTVKAEDGIISFDGPGGSERALIFYPGAKVDERAYAPLMQRISQSGIDCFIVGMPLHFPMFGGDRADEVIADHSYESYIIAGHSLGGVMASKYAAEHDDVISGLVLLASYPTVEIPDSIAMLSVLGSEDGVINTGAYEQAKSNWPIDSSDELIFGGNHAGFGNYGAQEGDGDATINQKTQWRQTAEVICEKFGTYQ